MSGHNKISFLSPLLFSMFSRRKEVGIKPLNISFIIDNVGESKSPSPDFGEGDGILLTLF